MIPKGLIWQHLRQKALSTVPEDSVASYSHPTNLTEWERVGYHTVTHSTKSLFHLETPSIDIGSALLCDAEHFLDAATEHQASLWQHVASREWLSPTWLTVTFYYWLFYLTLAVTRLLGRTAWYINKDTAKRLSQLVPGTSPTPGAGCFRLEVGPDVSAVTRVVTLRKHGTRVHEEIWTLWYDLLQSHLQPLFSASDYAEVRMYSAMLRASHTLGPDWPSALRNAVNYRPGFAYGAIRGVKVIDAYTYLRVPDSYNYGELVDRFDRRAGSVARQSLLSEPHEIAKLLADYAFLMHTLAEALHEDLIGRRRLDSRWGTARQRFRRQHRLKGGVGYWPT